MSTHFGVLLELFRMLLLFEWDPWVAFPGFPPSSLVSKNIEYSTVPSSTQGALLVLSLGLMHLLLNDFVIGVMTWVELCLFQVVVVAETRNQGHSRERLPR